MAFEIGDPIKIGSDYITRGPEKKMVNLRGCEGGYDKFDEELGHNVMLTVNGVLGSYWIPDTVKIEHRTLK